MDKTDLIYDMLKEVKEELSEVRIEVADLTACKNKLIGGAVLAGGIFTACYEVLKNFINKV